jgi:hypothetical protein
MLKITTQHTRVTGQDIIQLDAKGTHGASLCGVIEQ